ncbi:uncharacterized protein ARMOST_22123 [Armillaria ostoyae]|uniref:Uncharacterized protein n=1 Tax=Armillaria ostoyae TaxID=47428 RepID=A0A284SBZ7_ARMOS|nr:uncharacterized protein ARMOST_22123 [Armillaria ostoyae]
MRKIVQRELEHAEALLEPSQDGWAGKRLSEGWVFIIIIIISSAAPDDVPTTVLSPNDAALPACHLPSIHLFPARMHHCAQHTDISSNPRVSKGTRVFIIAHSFAVPTAYLPSILTPFQSQPWRLCLVPIVVRI